MKRGQGTFEYVLLLAGVLLIVVLAIVLLRGGVFGGGAKDVALQGCRAELAKSSGCYEGGVWKEDGTTTMGPACKSFIVNYPTNVGNTCDATGTDINNVSETIVCCGAKPA